jgi:hypothetical protein
LMRNFPPPSQPSRKIHLPQQCICGILFGPTDTNNINVSRVQVMILFHLIVSTEPIVQTVEPPAIAETPDVYPLDTPQPVDQLTPAPELPDEQPDATTLPLRTTRSGWESRPLKHLRDFYYFIISPSKLALHLPHTCLESGAKS